MYGGQPAQKTGIPKTVQMRFFDVARLILLQVLLKENFQEVLVFLDFF